LHWDPKGAKGFIKPTCEGEPEAGQGAKGGRFAGSTEEAGPMKPGNRAEEKTLTIRKKKKKGRSRKENPPLAMVNKQLKDLI